jgi:hypothetical protein
MSAKSIVEMAMDAGDGGHLIDRKKKAKIDNEEHPFAKNPAYPGRERGQKIASDAFGKVLKGVRSSGRTPAQLTQRQVFTDLMMTLERVIEIEEEHRPQLEELAVSIVLDLPEFRDARKAYAEGHIRINARLMPKMPPKAHQDNMDRIEPKTDDEAEQALGVNVLTIAQQLDVEVSKREVVNMLIQGAAVTKTHAYHMGSAILNEINPELIKLYGTLVALGDLSYWMKPEDVFGGEHGGEESIEVDEEDQVYTINATAINFPLLIQELVKGLYEVVAHNVVEDPQTRQHIYNKADTLKAEEWHIMKGPAVWMHLNHVVNKADGAQYMPRILNHLVTLSAGEFSDIVRGILNETPESLQYIKDTVAAIKADVEAEDAEEEDE